MRLPTVLLLLCAVLALSSFCHGASVADDWLSEDDGFELFGNEEDELLAKQPEETLQDPFSEPSEDSQAAEALQPGPGGASGDEWTRKKVIFGPLETQDYYLEMLGVVLIVVYVVNFWVGKQRNQALAKEWFTHVGPLIAAQFAGLGMHDIRGPDGQNSDFDTVVVKDSHNRFKLYASGRRNCHAVLVTLDLIKRQDLFSLLLSKLNSSKYGGDRVMMQVVLPNSTQQCVFVHCQKKGSKKFRLAHLDVETFASVHVSKTCGDQYVAMSDAKKLESQIISSALAKAIVTYPHLMEHIYLTSESQLTPFVAGVESEIVLSVSMLLPASEGKKDYTGVKHITQLSLYMIDRIAAIKLSKSALQQITALRVMAEKAVYKANSAQRQEEQQKRKQERLIEAQAKREAKANNEDNKRRKNKQKKAGVRLRRKGKK